MENKDNNMGEEITDSKISEENKDIELGEENKDSKLVEESEIIPTDDKYEDFFQQEQPHKIVNKKGGFVKGFVSGIILMIAVVIIFTGLLFYKNLSSESDGLDFGAIEDKLELLYEMMDYYYIYDADTDAMEEAVYTAFIEASGDTYAEYYTADEYEELLESITGEYEGIGVSVSQDDDGYITIVSVFDDSPAEDAGLESGDVLYAVEGTEVTGTDLSEVVSMIRGEEDTEVDLTILRDDETFDVTVARETVDAPSVYYKMIDEDENIGYIYISSFESAGVEQFNDALEDLEDQGMEKLIIDLRDNTGGELTAVCEMLDTLLPEGTIVSMEDNQGNVTEKTSDAENYVDFPIVILQNGYTASASEVFIGALQDYGMATTVGTTTYGKGVVQSILPVGDGSYLKVTTALYYTPNGRNIDGVGFDADYEIELDTSDGTDNQLEKALEVIEDLD